MEERKQIRRNGRMEGLKDRRIEGRKETNMEKWKDGRIEGQKNRWNRIGHLILRALAI